ncbi:hypothetical protein [Streptomyces sp. NPDC003717]|uniref:hypothetical protein n=1 Tax=Streptomyces sp. NPDC003717 TaxID=3154276 RepID=UPI0033AD0E7F
MKLPEDLAQLLRQVHERIEKLWLVEDTTNAYATVLKACDELEAIVASSGPDVARVLARDEDETLPPIARALGITEKAARARLRHYEYLNR